MRQLATADSTQLEAILDETYPIWGEGLSRSAYGAWNRAQMATRWGRANLRRVVLTDEGTVVASAKRYDFDAVVGAESASVVGIGAVFTPPAMRNRGYARALMETMVDDAVNRGCRYALLFSEIGPAYYESMGFRTIPRTLLSIEVIQKGGPPATFVRSGETTDLPEIADINRRYREGASFALTRSPEQIEFSFTRRRLLAGLGPAGHRSVEFFVTEEGYRAVAYVFITHGPGGIVVEECGDRDPTGARLGAMMQVLAGRTPAETPQPMTAWLPPTFRPPQIRVIGETPAREIMMIRPLNGAPMPAIDTAPVIYWNTDTF